MSIIVPSIRTYNVVTCRVPLIIDNRVPNQYTPQIQWHENDTVVEMTRTQVVKMLHAVEKGCDRENTEIQEVMVQMEL